MRCPRHRADVDHELRPPATHRTPTRIPSVLSRRARRGQKTNSASCPREAARCRHVSHAARIATPFGCCKPAVPSAVSTCRRFPDQKSPPATLDRPGLSPPERKAGTQELHAVLAGCGGSQIFTACMLSLGRKSPPSFVPAGSRPCSPSADPQARSPLSPSRRLTKPPTPLLSPLPAAFCGRVPRLRRDPRPQNAVPYSTTINQPTDKTSPYTPRLLDPTLHFGSIRAVCATRTSVLNSPLWGLWSPRGGRPVGFAAARRRARGSACKTRREKLPPTPFNCAREACRRRNPPQKSSPQSTVAARSYGHSQGGRRPEPHRPLRVRRPRGLRRLDRTLGSPRADCSATCQGLRGRRLRFPKTTRRLSTASPSAAVPLPA